MIHPFKTLINVSFNNFFFVFLFLQITVLGRLATQTWLEVGQKWTSYQNTTSPYRLKVEFRVTCDVNYYGKGCENLCRPRNDNFGHFTCSPAGERVCLAGWQGDYCTKRKWQFVFVQVLTASVFFFLFIYLSLFYTINIYCTTSHRSYLTQKTFDYLIAGRLFPFTNKQFE